MENISSSCKMQQLTTIRRLTARLLHTGASALFGKTHQDPNAGNSRVAECRSQKEPKRTTWGTCGQRSSRPTVPCRRRTRYDFLLVFCCYGPVWARERCRISPPRFLAECCKRQLNQGSFVLLYFKLFTFSDLY